MHPSEAFIRNLSTGLLRRAEHHRVLGALAEGSPEADREEEQASVLEDMARHMMEALDNLTRTPEPSG